MSDSNIMSFLSTIKLPEEVVNSVVQQYSGFGRYYHTLQHIDEMLNYFEKFKFLLVPEIYTTMKFAIIYHDFFCDPRRNDNETRSAYYASGLVEVFKIKQIDPKNVCNLIESTTLKQPASLTLPQQFIRDIDRLILSSNPSRFAEYERQIRKEYYHVSDEAYKIGREQVVKQLWNNGRPFNIALINDLFYQNVELNLNLNLNLN